MGLISIESYQMAFVESDPSAKLAKSYERVGFFANQQIFRKHFG